MDTDDASYAGLSIQALFGWAVLLAVVAVGCLFRMLAYVAGDAGFEVAMLLWVLLGTVAAAASATCGVSVAVKTAERRILARLEERAEP